MKAINNNGKITVYSGVPQSFTSSQGVHLNAPNMTEQALKDRIQDAETKISEQRDLNHSHQTTIADLNSKLDGLSAQLADRASEISAASALRTQLEDQIQNQQSAHDRAEEEWQTVKEERAARIAELEAQLRHEQGERQATEDEARVHVESLESQRASLEASLAERREELISTRTRLETELERQAAQLGEARQEVAQLVTEIEDHGMVLMEHAWGLITHLKI